jgi:hypothetical protein
MAFLSIYYLDGLRASKCQNGFHLFNSIPLGSPHTFSTLLIILIDFDLDQKNIRV